MSIAYKPNVTCCGVRPTYALLDQDMVNHFSSCPGGTPEAPLIDWAWSVVGKPGGLFLDIGSHVGSWGLPFAMAGMNTIAFEANTTIANLLQESIFLNGLSDRESGATFAYINVALSDQIGTATLTAPGIDGGMASIVRQFGGPVNQEIETTTLDEFFYIPDVIKIDVEGAEVDVLRGGKKTILAHKPTIFFECWEDERGQRIGELFEYVRKDLKYEAIKTEWPEMWMAVPA